MGVEIKETNSRRKNVAIYKTVLRWQMKKYDGERIYLWNL